MPALAGGMFMFGDGVGIMEVVEVVVEVARVLVEVLVVVTLAQSL